MVWWRREQQNTLKYETQNGLISLINVQCVA